MAVSCDAEASDILLCHTKTRFNKNSRKLALFQIFIIKERLNNDDCIPSPLLMLYLKEILYQVLDRNNVYDHVILLFDDCELDNLPDMVIQQKHFHNSGT